MYKIKKEDIRILICLRKRSIGCSYDEAEAQIMTEYNMAEDIREKNQIEHKKQYMKEYNKKRYDKLKREKCRQSIIPYQLVA